MKCNIQATGFELTPAIKDYATSKLASTTKFLGKVNQGTITCSVELERTTSHHTKGEIYRAEVNMSVEGVMHRSETSSTDLYAAIDLLRDELARKIKSEKGKSESIFKRGARAVKSILKSN